MTTPVLQVESVSRSFGDIRAVDRISFEVFAGQVVGFIGANGAGKTTTMRMMAMLDLPDSGVIRIGGLDTALHGRSLRPRIGWMPDQYGTYEQMTVFEYLDFFARSYQLRGEDRTERVRDVMEFIDLAPLADRFIDTLSKGQSQRLCLGRTLIHDPDILILDEPAAGLDPKARVEFKHYVRVLAEEGKTIFISSHILSELEDMSDSLLMIDKGAIIHHGSADTLVTPSGTEVIVDIKVTEGDDRLREWLPQQPHTEVLEGLKQGASIRFQGTESQLVELLRALLRDGFLVTDFHRRERKLEDAFIEVLQRTNRGQK
jgi:ABC-2 type transport system ATP-binding protein